MVSLTAYYVYLLVEQKPGGDEVFYVGKGKNARAAAHLQEYVRSIARGAASSDELRKAGVVPLADHSDTPVESAEPSDRIEEHAKVQRIRAAHASGNEVRVDLLRTELSEDLAYAIESAVIDAIGLENLTNEVHGRGHGRVPALTAARVLDAKDVTIGIPAFQVVVAGVRGGGNSLSGLVGAEDADSWENASQSWAISAELRDEIDLRGCGDEPFVLVAVAKGPSQTYGGIILGLWEIARVEPGSERVDVNGRASAGWRYVAAPETPRVKELRARYLHRRSVHDRQPTPVRIG